MKRLITLLTLFGIISWTHAQIILSPGEIDNYEWEHPSTPNITMADANNQINVDEISDCDGQCSRPESSPVIPSSESSLTTQVSSNDCGRVLSSFNQRIYNIPVRGAVFYEWKFIDSSYNITTHKRLNGATNFKLALIDLHTLNVTYNVQVRAYVKGGWQNYGPTCPITSPSSSGTPIISQANNDQ